MGRTPTELAWLAGLLEGEGCFTFDRRPCIQVQMTDRDVIVRAAQVMGSPSVRPAYNRTPKLDGTSRKPLSVAGAYGTRAIEIMMTIYPLMGLRRQDRIRYIIAEWRKRRSRYRGGLHHRQDA